ncbi:MAG: 4-hydroxy-tetrahydrodipicolinate reductase [Gammaproteobacteria bacterium]|nr:4-hydroxy-tetrahydrodipicolinate reductase [Gammaproteobacteria bacterium]MDH3507268.1 4-hydroxy-tetrahydrodipicolinate reductase [Gammaproteobacteria bacterium]
MLKVAVLGASGRMGKAILACLVEADDLTLVGAVTEPSDPALGDDAGELAGVGTLGVPLTDDRAHGLHAAQVAIDFTLPAAAEANARACVDHGTALVVGTTGLAEQQLRTLETAAQTIPIVYARNMSVGVNVFMDLVSRAAVALGSDYDVEIIEAHHRQKVDAPSGTALDLGERVAAATGRALDDLAIHGRHGHTGPRVPGTIGFSVIRAGSIVGDHTVMFAAPEERIELSHHAIDRKSFARGAVRAARWLAAQPPGLYSMADVLGLGHN